MTKLVRTTRYFRFQQIDVDDLQKVIGILTPHRIATWEFTLCYPSETLGVNKFADVTSLIAEKGPPRRVKLLARAVGGRMCCFDATDSRFISVEFYSREVNPEKEVDKIQKALSLSPRQVFVDTAFLAHAFDQRGKQYAIETREFLELQGIRVTTGEPFGPGNVPEKVKGRIDACDLFVAIVTQDQPTWIKDEIIFAVGREKRPLVLVDNAVNFQPAMLGDTEYIPFPAGHVSGGFVKLLQGLNQLRGFS